MCAQKVGMPRSWAEALRGLAASHNDRGERERFRGPSNAVTACFESISGVTFPKCPARVASAALQAPAAQIPRRAVPGKRAASQARPLRGDPFEIVLARHSPLGQVGCCDDSRPKPRNKKPRNKTARIGRHTRTPPFGRGSPGRRLDMGPGSVAAGRLPAPDS
jgi:hypothetical protein